MTIIILIIMIIVNNTCSEMYVVERIIIMIKNEDKVDNGKFRIYINRCAVMLFREITCEFLTCNFV